MANSKNKCSLIVTAHPDDETIFFAGLVLSRPRSDWKIICVTDGNADGDGPRRKTQWENACTTLGVHSRQQLNYPDIFENRLPVQELATRLAKEDAQEVFTHGPTGEYGHPHHQDVSYATHLAFKDICPVNSIAVNSQADLTVMLDQAEYQKKCEIYSNIYFSETQRFYQMLPCHWAEGFNQLDFVEVEAVYRYFAEGKVPSPEALKKYQWLSVYFKAGDPATTLRRV